MFTRISHFDGTRNALRPMERVDNVREAARDFRRDMLAKPQVLFYKTFELVRVPYPSKFAYLNAFGLPTPYVHLCNRLFVIQFSSEEGIKTLLVSPSDWENQRATPFFAKPTGAEVIINGNTQEYVVDQYISMVQEKSIAGPNPVDERFPNMVPSSEAQPYWLFPGTAPTLHTGNLQFGQLSLPVH